VKLAIETGPTKIAKRFEGIDVLRGLSIVVLLLHHINLRFLPNDVPLEPTLPEQLSKILFWNGANGVTVFFAVSGFLITTVALRRWSSLGAISVVDSTNCGLRELRCATAARATCGSQHSSPCQVEGFVIPPERSSLGRALFADTVSNKRRRFNGAYIPALKGEEALRPAW
jgi:hypothetical protein